jgi:trehalose/maltose transport system permease protein
MVDIWKTTPFMALLILAGLQMIPNDIYEAAEIDGVHPVRQFFKITLPLVRPALMVAIIFRLLDALRIFDLIYVLTPNSSGDQDHVGHLAREPVRFRQVRLRLGAIDAAVPDHRADDASLYLAGQA